MPPGSKQAEEGADSARDIGDSTKDAAVKETQELHSSAAALFSKSFRLSAWM